MSITRTKTILVLIFITLFSFKSFAQVLSEKNEEVIFSFKTIDNQNIILSTDKNENYIVLRIVSDEQIEFIFPKELNEKSWKKFQYSYWLRGGGIDNLGIDLNYLYFIKENQKYILYQTYFAENNETKIGLKIVDLNDKEIRNYKGLLNTQSGSLVELRENDKIKEGEELFD